MGKQRTQEDAAREREVDQRFAILWRLATRATTWVCARGWLRRSLPMRMLSHIGSGIQAANMDEYATTILWKESND